MQPADILKALHSHGLLDASDDWSLEPASGGLNSRVFQVRRGNASPYLTVRVARPGQRFDHEVQALEEVAHCPGVPRPLLATGQLLVHEYLPGAPAPLGDVDESSLMALVGTLACLHRSPHHAYTAWPEHTLIAGTHKELFLHRVASLRSYETYGAALAGELDARLPALIEAVAALDLDASEWDVVEFARLHGDLSIGNLLWSAQDVGLIDWEYTRIGDPAEDLAYLLTEQPVPASTVSALRRFYEEAGGALDAWRRVPAYGVFTALDSALWWADYLASRDLPRGRSELEARLATAGGWLAGGFIR